MITAADAEIGARIKSVVDHGRDGSLQSQEVGTNMRMSEVFAAIGRVQLKHLDDWLARRRSNAALLSETIGSHPKLQAPQVRPDSQHAWHQYCLQTENVEAFLQHMATNDIDARKIYPVPCHQHPCTFLPNLSLLLYMEKVRPDTLRGQIFLCNSCVFLV